MTVWYPGMSEEEEQDYQIEVEKRKTIDDNLSKLELQIKALVSEYNKISADICNYNDKHLIYSIVPHMNIWPNRWYQDDNTEIEDIIEWGIQNKGWQSSSWNC